MKRGVFRAILDLQPDLVADILNFEPFVTNVTDMDATVNVNKRITSILNTSDTVSLTYTNRE